jgi:formate hydrogenlyase subunit 3/multisubunit Na+/H+ antiporter MnhD subunit
MAILQQIAGLHVLMCAAIGSRLSKRWMVALSLAGLGWTVIQSAAAEIFFLWGPPFGVDNRVEFHFMSTSDFFGLAFRLGATGGWATLLAAGFAFAAQLHALPSVAHFTGRHRYHALVLVLTGAAAFLFSADSPTAFLIGWEGLALSGAFLYAFWEAEERGARPGMRWLLFQRASGLLLLMGFLAIDGDYQLGAVLIVAAAFVRAGQLPFHGWVPGSTRGPASATALVNGIGSALAAVYLLDRFWLLISAVDKLPEVMGVVVVAGLALGILSALQQQDPEKALGWLFMFQTAFALLGFAVGDPAAATILVTGEVLVLGGAVLAIGGLSGPATELAKNGTSGYVLRSRLAYVILGLAWACPPSICFMGTGRLLGSVPHNTVGLLLQIGICLAAIGMGWMLQWFSRTLPARRDDDQPQFHKFGIASLLLWLVAFALGIAGLIAIGWHGVGGLRGLSWGFGVTGCAVVGWILGQLLARPRRIRFIGRLTYTQRIMDRLAETGLGIGEIVVQLPLVIVRALGVVFWRGIGDFLVDTLILGSAVRTVEGVGIVLRFIQNGWLWRP